MCSYVGYVSIPLQHMNPLNLPSSCLLKTTPIISISLSPIPPPPIPFSTCFPCFLSFLIIIPCIDKLKYPTEWSRQVYGGRVSRWSGSEFNVSNWSLRCKWEVSSIGLHVIGIEWCTNGVKWILLALKLRCGCEWFVWFLELMSSRYRWFRMIQRGRWESVMTVAELNIYFSWKILQGKILLIVKSCKCSGSESWNSCSVRWEPDTKTETLSARWKRKRQKRL